MTSSLTPRGSTRAWRNLRTQWQQAINNAAATGNPIRCWRTGQPITPGMEWDLGHRIDRAHGGTDSDVHPELPGPNRSAGANNKPRTRRW